MSVEGALPLKSEAEGEGGKGDGGGGEGLSKGLGFGMTSFFLIAQMAGAGFLSLPKAVANTGMHDG